MVVEFVVHGDLDDAGYRCCVVIAAPVTLVKLREHFAFENVCLFRQKVCGSTIGYPDIDHLWLDLDDSDMNAELPNCTEVQALIVNGPESEETYSYDEYLADLANTIPDERLLNSFQKESAPITLKSIGKVLNDITEGVKSNAVLNKNIKNLKNGVTQVWKNVGEFASKLQQQPPRPVDAYVTSPVASELSLLSIKAATNFRDSNPEHLNLLRKVFEALFPGQSQSFKRKSVTWKDAGYQNQDPVADLKKTGLISLCGIVYLGDTIPERLQMMVQSNKTNIKTNYPFAVVAVNLSMLLIELFHLRENRFVLSISNTQATALILLLVFTFDCLFSFLTR